MNLLLHSHTHTHSEGLLDVIIHTFESTISILPLLFIIYFVIELINLKNSARLFSSKYAPISASFLGLIPQCGMSVVASGLYNQKVIKAGTLIAIFISTSDEFLPIVLTENIEFSYIIMILAIKLVLAMFVGIILNITLFKNEQITQNMHTDECCNHNHNPLKHALIHTAKIALMLLVFNLVIEIIFMFIDMHVIEDILLTGNIFQPFLTALIGLIPSCYISILLTELFVSGSISLGSVIAGLSTGAGFGYIILFKGSKKQAFKIIAITYLISSVTGVIINLIM